tara:strand:+ start:1540 stop:1860 length:321 start_codon:yes stop_codon:yes gene_type:complete
MATVIKIKRSETASDAPTTSDLVAGEVALNTADQIMYVRDSNGNIVKVSNFSEADQSLIFPTGDYGSVADSLTTDAFGQQLDKTFDCNTSIKFRVQTVELGSSSSI